jgi:hypothetical protein
LFGDARPEYIPEIAWYLDRGRGSVHRDPVPDGTNPISIRDGTNPIQARNGTNPISNRDGTNPISNRDGTNPISMRAVQLQVGAVGVDVKSGLP